MTKQEHEALMGLIIGIDTHARGLSRSAATIPEADRHRIDLFRAIARMEVMLEYLAPQDAPSAPAQVRKDKCRCEPCQRDRDDRFYGYCEPCGRQSLGSDDKGCPECLR